MVTAVLVALVLGRNTANTTGTSNERLHELAGQLKCLQCVGESVATSQATIAVEMREEIKRQQRLGASNDEILSYFASRYGEDVLLNPGRGGAASLIWILPVIAVAAGVAGIVLVARRRRAELAAAGPLDPTDEALVESHRRDHSTTDGVGDDGVADD
jgi:cytochrome c-type biogenesis protein CcmH